MFYTDNKTFNVMLTKHIHSQQKVKFMPESKKTYKQKFRILKIRRLWN